MRTMPELGRNAMLTKTRHKPKIFGDEIEDVAQIPAVDPIPAVDLTQVSATDLTAELERRRKVEEDRINALRQAQADTHLAHIDGFLAVVTEHSRTSCSDDDPCNSGRCNRCTLLGIKRDDYWPIGLGASISLYEN